MLLSMYLFIPFELNILTSFYRLKLKDFKAISYVDVQKKQHLLLGWLYIRWYLKLNAQKSV